MLMILLLVGVAVMVRSVESFGYEREGECSECGSYEEAKNSWSLKQRFLNPIKRAIIKPNIWD